MPLHHTLLLTIPTLEILLAGGVTAVSEYVTFPSSDGRLQLEGTLRLPCSANNNDNEPVPGVVLIHGSGPNSRHYRLAGDLLLSFGFAIPAFHEIGDALQNQGIAVLTYDKRTCSAWNACNNNDYPTLSSEEVLLNQFLEDAQAAVSYLAGRNEVKSNAVVVVGHSQGGAFVPIMLESQPDVLRSGIMVSTSFDPIDELGAYQLEYLLDYLISLGYTESEAKQLPGIPEIVELVEFRQGVRNGTILAEDDQAATSAGITAAFVQSEFDLEQQALSAASSLSQPLLVLGGEADQKVPVNQVLLWGDYLEAKGTADFELKKFPCVTHSLNCVNDTSAQATLLDVGKHVDSRLVDALIAFVQKTTRDTRVETSCGLRHCHGQTSTSLAPETP